MSSCGVSWSDVLNKRYDSAQSDPRGDATTIYRSAFNVVTNIKGRNPLSGRNGNPAFM